MNIITITQKLSVYQRKTISPKQNLKTAAVLVPLVNVDDELHLLFTKRTEHVEHHKGQISFPGGMADETDSSLIHTALREVEEEIGLPHTSVKILTSFLDDIQTPSGFLVTPIVGYIAQLPSLTPNHNEVAEIFFIPLVEFFDEQKRSQKIISHNGEEKIVSFYNVGKEPIWGVTGMFIKNFVDIVK